MTDRVTGMPGMRSFLDQAEKQISQMEDASSVYVIFFNIINFKSYNINHGVNLGDHVLENVSLCLKHYFSEDLIGRAADDHFLILTEKEDLTERIARVHEEFSTIYAVEGMEMKAGVCSMKEHGTSISVACDFAKIACDAIKISLDEYVGVFNQALNEKRMVSDYVVREIDHAIENHYIKVYYQPVVRTINRMLCGMEALARWDDPEKGLLSPYYFISALEESKLISKLDLYMIREVCYEMRNRLDQGLACVPVSFNLSRIDFLTCDIFEEVQDALRSYDIPRDMIRIEVTESLITKNATVIEETLKKFQDAGYQVWMDDFGSEYSSLNLLKDYNFDEIKIDMGFLSSFTEKSKFIIRSMVDMAKNLGIQTLAEGVETEEHFEYLKQIGCEKVQGYFFGKPMPLEDTIAHCEAQGLQMETRSWQKYYDKVGKVSLTTDLPIGLYEFDGKIFHQLFYNRALENVFTKLGTKNMEVAEQKINSPLSPLLQQFVALHNTIYDEEEYREIEFSVRGQYLRLRAKRIAENGERSTYEVTLQNLTRNVEQKAIRQMDETFRSLYHMYDALYLADIGKNHISHVMQQGSFETDAIMNIDQMPLEDAIALARRELIHPDDQAQFDVWLNLSTLQERIQQSGKGSISEFFRTREANGSFIWKMHRMLVIPGTGFKKYIFAILDTPLANYRTMQRVGQNLGVSDTSDTQRNADLWTSFADSDMAHLFWKDKNRRFVGANQKFLDFYGIKDMVQLIGKTDEDMMWHVDDEEFRRDEWDVLTKGVTLSNRIGKCIVQGQQHMIMATKTPIYENGEITGLLGYFIDLDSVSEGEKDIYELHHIDAVTGLLNTHGMIEAMTDFAGEWEADKVGFASIILKLHQFSEFVDWYGRETVKEILRIVGGLLQEGIGHSAVCGRIYGGTFHILLKYEDKEDVQDEIDILNRKLSKIQQVGEYEVTLSVDSDVVYTEETPDIAAMARMIFQGTVDGR